MTVLRPFTVAAGFGEGCTCRRRSALPFISRETSLPLFADSNGPGLGGTPLLAGGGLWGETPKTII